MVAKRLASLMIACALIAGCGGGGNSPSAPEGGEQPQVPAGDSVFPLRIESGKRYLIDASNTPFFIQGDAAWSLIARLTREEARQYLDDRQALGFNTVLVNLIEHQFTDDPPKNAYGEGPFTCPGDFSTPNERYFDHADFVLREARARGMLVLLAPAYLGYEGGPEGWYAEMLRNGPERLEQYGRYAAQRLREHSNLIWVQGGDFYPPEDRLFEAVAEGIVAGGSPLLHTYHGARNSSAFGLISPQPTWLRLNNIYTTDNNVISFALAEYDRSQAPFLLLEAEYEALRTDALGVRREAYQGVLSGAAGHVIGHRDIWKFAPGWQNFLHTPASTSIIHLAELMRLLQWPALAPDTSRKLIVGGRGSEEQEAAVSLSADRKLAVIYVPTRRDIVVDTGQLGAASPFALHWFDPATGQLTEVPGSPAASDMITLTPPIGSSTTDWVAILGDIPATSGAG